MRERKKETVRERKGEVWGRKVERVRERGKGKEIPKDRLMRKNTGCSFTCEFQISKKVCYQYSL